MSDRTGHRAITQEATSKLFSHAARDGKVLGKTEHEFFMQLDKAQAHADRWYGDTWHQAQDDPGAQRKHSLADPHKSGAENLKDIQNFISGQLEMAKAYHLKGDYKMEWQCLGAAVHALEDSYSNAHVFRDPHDATNPYAPIEAINVFYWFDTGTHQGVFDEVPVTEGYLERATDQAASEAAAIILLLYNEHINNQFDVAIQPFAQEVSTLLHGDNILVLSDTSTPEYLAERAAHYDNEISFDPGSIIQHHGADSSVPDDQQNFSSPDQGTTVNDGTIHNSADSSQPDYSQQSYSADSDMTLNDGTIHQSADSSQPAYSQQNYSVDPNMTLNDGTIHHGADSSQLDHSQQSYSTEPNMTLNDGTTHYAADSSQPDHSQQSFSTEPNMTLNDGTIHQGADSSQTNHSQNYSSPDSNMTLNDGTAVHHGADTSQTTGQSQSNSFADANSSPHSEAANSAASASYCYPLDVIAKKGSSPADHQSRKDNQQGGKFNNWQSRNAWDLVVPYGTPVYAVADGVIGKQIGPLAKNDPLLAGLRLTVESDGNKFYYAHLSKFADGITAGQIVKQGELIGYSGKAGGVEHLHFAAQHENSVDTVLYDSQLHYDGNGDIHYEANAAPGDPNTPDAVQNYTPSDSNISLTDGTTTLQGAPGGIPDVTLNHSSQDASTTSNDGTMYHDAGGGQPDHLQQNYSADPNSTLNDGTMYHDAGGGQPDHLQQNYSADPNTTLNDGTIHHDADSSQPDHLQQSYSTDSGTTPGDATSHHGADSSQTGSHESSDSSSSSPNQNVPDEPKLDFHSITEFATSHSFGSFDRYHHPTIIPHVNPFNVQPHSSQPDHSLQIHIADISQPDHLQQGFSADSSQPDHSPQGFSADSSQPDHSPQIHSADSTQPNHSPQIHSADSTQPDHSQQIHSADSTQPDHSQQSHSADSSQIDHSQQSFSADNSQPDHSQQSHAADSGQTDSHQSQTVQHNVHDDGSQSMHP